MSCYTSSALSNRRRSPGLRRQQTHHTKMPRGTANLFEHLENRVLMSATTYVVDTLADTIDGSDSLTSLREAVIAANQNPGADQITFAVDGTFDLSLSGTNEDAAITGDLDITDDLTITGNGAANTVINANGIDRVFDLLAGNSATLENITITGGSATTGGGVLNRGSLTITDAEFHHNSATNGGAIFNNIFTSALTVHNTYFHDNNASNGGALFNNALTNINGNTIFTSNTAVNEGGAILNRSILNLNGSDTSPILFDSNTAIDGGAILNDSNLNINRTLFENNSADEGGAIFNNNDVEVTATTFTGNTAIDGGAIYNDSDLIALNTTFSANTATASGGAIYNTEELTSTNSTLTLNSAERGGGIYNTPSALSTLANTLVAQNTASISGPDLANDVTSLGHNLIGNADGSNGITHGINGDQAGSTATPINPQLDVLSHNGGPTMTHALLSSSPAIDTGDNSLLPAGTVTDQRGEARITDGDIDTIATIDIGAFELPEPTIIPADLTISAITTSAVEGNEGSKLYTFTVTRSNNESDLTVDVHSADGTAIAGEDYTALGVTTLNFIEGGELSQDIQVSSLGDVTVELDETFQVELSNPTGPANITVGSATATIENDDSATISIADATITEGDNGDSIIDFIVTLSAEVDAPVNVAFMTADGTATSFQPPDFALTSDSALEQTDDVDYMADAGTVTFDDTTGLTHTISITVKGDTTAELDEAFFLNLADTDAAGRDVTIADDQASGTILRDDVGASLENGELVIIGSELSDHLVIYKRMDGNLKVRGSFIDASRGLQFNGDDVQRIVTVLDGGHDRAWISRRVEVPAIILAGDGHDRVVAGGGPTVISGGNGHDFLMGRHQNDILIGGQGRDRIFSRQGNDILIAGTTNYDDDHKALGMLLTEWNDDATYEDRIDNLRNGTGTLAGSDVKLAANETVHDDDQSDLLVGGSGRDWYLAEVDDADGDDDHVFWLHSGEVLDELL